MLKQFLKSMLDEAKKKERMVVKRKLKGNLHLALVVTDKDVQISIARDKVYPSAAEWKTVLACFPYQVPQVAPRSFIDSDRRFAMRGKLPLPQQLAFSDQLSEAGDQPSALSEEPEMDKKI